MKLRQLDIAQPSQVDYLLTMALIALSGNMALVNNDRRDIAFLFFALIGVLRMVVLKRNPTKRMMLVYLALMLLFGLQSAALNFFAPVTIIGFFTKLTVAATIAATVTSFRLAFVRCMVWVTKLSLLFHIPVVLLSFAGVRLYQLFQPLANIVGVAQHDVQVQVNIGLHNFQTGENLIRNAGMFWEPGAFSGYLTLALLVLATLRSDLPRRLRKRWALWLIAGILSTLSTTGLIILPLALTMFILARRATQRAIVNNAIRLTVAAVILVPLSYFVWQLDFVGPKITELYYRAVYQEAGWELSRFGAVIFDWAYIVERPILGWGQNNTTQYALNPDLDRLALGNGFTGYLRQLGLAGMAILVISLWAGLRASGLGPVARAWFILVLLLLLNGQYFMDYPLFLSLHFLGLRSRALPRFQFQSHRHMPERMPA